MLLANLYSSELLSKLIYATSFNVNKTLSKVLHAFVFINPSKNENKQISIKSLY